MLTCAFFTLGCKVNQYETEKIKSSALKLGYNIIDSFEAEVVIINTCTVTKASDHKSRQLIYRAIKNNSNKKIIVTGCYTEEVKEKIKNLPNLVFLNNEEKEKIPQIMKNWLESSPENFPKTEIKRVRQFLKIQDGCNNFCSYCIVPYVRGRSRSREEKEILKEAEEMAKEGVKEIVLCGICLGSYGKDLTDKNSLVSLIEKIEKIEFLKRIRLSSIELKDITEDLIGKIMNSSKVCQHLHIPLQSADNNILKRMNRNYTAEEYADFVFKIKNLIPEIAVTTDILVGFPGETEEQFNNTYNFLKKTGFAKAHIFKYSIREKTKAANFSEQIPGNAKKKRSQILIEEAKRQRKNFLKNYLGKNVSVLIENKKENDFFEGLTKNYIRVQGKNEKVPLGDILSVKILSGDNSICHGEILSPL